jgi:hypothetical protein
MEKASRNRELKPGTRPAWTARVVGGIGGRPSTVTQVRVTPYERRSVAVSSNLHPAGFDELMPKTLATATVDRLLHHAHLCTTQGDSVRLSQATAGKGVVPLT